MPQFEKEEKEDAKKNEMTESRLNWTALFLFHFAQLKLIKIKIVLALIVG